MWPVEIFQNARSVGRQLTTADVIYSALRYFRVKTGFVPDKLSMCICATVAELIMERQNAGWQHILELNDSQIAAYILIASAHLLNALPENPTDLIVGVIAWRRRMTDDVGGPAAAAESGLSASAHILQPPTRRVAPGSTARNATVVTVTVEHNNK